MIYTRSGTRQVKILTVSAPYNRCRSEPVYERPQYFKLTQSTEGF